MQITLGYDYPTIRHVLRGYYSGRGWVMALRAMDIGLKVHSGERKNGEPEFSHQIFQAQYARTLDPLLMEPETVHCTIMLHDIVEDHEYPLESIRRDFNDRVYQAVRLISNTFDGYNKSAGKKPKKLYYERIGQDPSAGPAKGIDRMHNLQSCLKVFDAVKKRSYIDETKEEIIPLLKAGRKLFPQQERVYHNLRHVLSTQIDLMEYALTLEKS